MRHGRTHSKIKLIEMHMTNRESHCGPREKKSLVLCISPLARPLAITNVAGLKVHGPHRRCAQSRSSHSVGVRPVLCNKKETIWMAHNKLYCICIDHSGLVYSVPTHGYCNITTFLSMVLHRHSYKRWIRWTYARQCWFDA